MRDYSQCISLAKRAIPIKYLDTHSTEIPKVRHGMMAMRGVFECLLSRPKLPAQSEKSCHSSGDLCETDRRWGVGFFNIFLSGNVLKLVLGRKVFVFVQHSGDESSCGFMVPILRMTLKEIFLQLLIP